MGDIDEINEVPENREERQRIPRRTRPSTSPLNLQGEQHPLLTLPQEVLPFFLGDGSIDMKRHIDQLLVVCNIHLIENDDVMVRVVLQTLTRRSYQWYLFLLAQSISSFDYLEKMF
jgi:hypothetical protein